MGIDILATVRQISVKVCVMVELGPGNVFSPFDGDIFRGLQMRGQKMASGGPFWSLRHRFLPVGRE